MWCGAIGVTGAVRCCVFLRRLIVPVPVVQVVQVVEVVGVVVIVEVVRCFSVSRLACF